MSSDGSYLAFAVVCGYEDATDYRAVKFYDSDGDVLWDQTDPHATPYNVWVSQGGDKVLVRWSNNRVAMYSASGSMVFEHTEEDDIYSASMSESGNQVAFGTFPIEKDSTVSYLENGVEQWSTTAFGGIEAISVSPNGEYIAVGTSERFIEVAPWALEDNKLMLFNESGGNLWTKQLDSAIVSLDLSYDGTHIAVGTDNGRTILFDANGSELWSVDKGGYVSISNGGDVVLSYDLFSFTLFDKLGALLFEEKSIRPLDAALSSDGTTIAVSGIGENEPWDYKNADVYYFDAQGNLIWEYSPHQSPAPHVSISYSGGFVGAGAGNYLYLFDDGLPKLDTDGDGTPDDQDVDDDGDSIPDTWEDEHDLNRTNPNDAFLDKDEDGYSNLAEFQNSTDPGDPESHPVVPEKSDDNGFVAWIVAIAVAVAVIIVLFAFVRKKRGDGLGGRRFESEE